MKRLFLILFIIVLCAGYGRTQTVFIFDNSDLQPIPGVLIENEAKTKHIISNDFGSADLSSFTGDEKIVFSHLAFQTMVLTKKELGASGFKVYLTEKAINLDEVVISATRSEQNRSDLPQKMEFVTAKQIAFSNPQTGGELLRQTGNVFVQQSQQGGGSPVLRGFEANRVLLAIDGIRLNNAIYRSGHLQNVITIDPFMLDHAEVIFGPGSVMYGSDALGGVMHFYTKNPELSKTGKPLIKTEDFIRFSSANSEMAAGIRLNFGYEKWGFLTTVAYKDLGDLREGKWSNPYYGNWGRNYFYAERIGNSDSMMANPDTLIQKNSGYMQYDVMQKVLFQPNSSTSFILNIQYSNTSNVPRYDRLTQMSGSNLKYAEWYYGPQTRLLSSVRADFRKSNLLFDKGSVIFAYQNISEDRISRRFNKSDRNHQEETVDVFSLNAEFQKKTCAKGNLNYGIETDFNQVGSVAYNENINTGELKYNTATRYPDSSNSMNTFAGYLFHHYKINPKFSTSQGIRFNYITLKSVYSDTMMSLMKFPFNPEISQKNSALNGSLGLVYTPGKDWKFSVSATNGFRVPNIDDLTKVNDSKSTDKLVVVPNPDLKPEKAYNLDFNIEKTFKKTLYIQATGFYTLLKDAIVIRPFLFNGSDSILFNGVMCAVQAGTNKAEAYIYGTQFSFLAQITSAFSIKSNLSYTYGRVVENNTETPLDHIPPLYGTTSLRLELKQFKGEFYLNYSGWKHLADYSSSGEDNLEYATPLGNPSWCTLNLKTAYTLNQQVMIQMGIENILDLHYRQFASGFSAPGRNIIVAIRGNFKN